MYSSWNCWQKTVFAWALVSIVVFLAIWVIFPIIFMNTKSLQRFLIFYNRQDPKNPEFDNPQKYDLDGVINFYITTKNSTQIGAWLLVPEIQIKNTSIWSHDIQTASKILKETTYPIVLYLHGVGCNRIKAKQTYDKLRKHFMIISLDHRGYGDSGSGAPPDEMGIVNDTCHIFKWIILNSKNDVYIWGHSLGGALSANAVKVLKKTDQIVPSGLILESTFTTMNEAISASQIGQIFMWVPWFEATVLNPLEKNGFLFKTTTNILHVDCPIMILHSEDDNIIPYTLGKQLAEVAATQRNIPEQGNVTYHQFRKLGYKHTGLTADPDMPRYIKEFVNTCKEQNKGRG